jgi:hypothetical protein
MWQLMIMANLDLLSAAVTLNEPKIEDPCLLIGLG